MSSMRALLVVLLGAFGVLAKQTTSHSQLAESKKLLGEGRDHVWSLLHSQTVLSHDVLSDPVISPTVEDINAWESSTDSMMLIGSAANDTCGRQVSNIGDFNKDGYADFAIGCHLTDKYNKINNGQVFVFLSHGSWPEFTDRANFASGANGFSVTGASDYDELGRVVSGTGDVNGDGFDDILVSSSSASSLGRIHNGIAYVVAQLIPDLS